MGKKLRFQSLFLVILFSCMLMIIPLLDSVKEAEANDHPWADLYGFMYPAAGGYLWSAKGCTAYSMGHHAWCNFSGTEEYWNWDYPCTNLCLRSNGWSSTPYCSYAASKAKENLKNNAIFVFFGHSSIPGHALAFYNGSAYSTLTASYVRAYQYNLDDMKFAFLLTCLSMADSNVAQAFRDRLVDMVWGCKTNFQYKVISGDGSILMYPGHVYNQEFWRAAERIPGTNVQSSMAWAITWVEWHCDNTWGLEGHDLLGKQNDTPPEYVRWVEDGRIGQ